MSINRVAFTKLPFPHFGGKGLGDGGTNFRLKRLPWSGISFVCRDIARSL